MDLLSQKLQECCPGITILFKTLSLLWQIGNLHKSRRVSPDGPSPSTGNPQLLSRLYPYLVLLPPYHGIYMFFEPGTLRQPDRECELGATH